MEKLKLKVITSYKLADAFICLELQKHFPQMEIIRYKINIGQRRKWYIKKLRKEGFWRSAGIKLMGIYLGFGNMYNQLRTSTIWQQLHLRLPDWNHVHATKYNCHTEDHLFTLLKDAEYIISLDTVRLPQKFFHQVKAPFLQAVYGMAPHYTGHTGVFWAYANHDYKNTGISIVQRGKYFNACKVLATAQISFTTSETLRSLRTRASVKIAEVLPGIIQNRLQQSSKKQNITTPKPITYCTTPTLYFYLKFRLINTLENILQPQKQRSKSYVYYKM